MLKSFIERENEILGIIEAISKSGLRYVLVGGYAVSAYMHRFSVDADVCIDKRDSGLFRSLLEAKHFSMAKRRELEDVYKGEFECYIKRAKLPVTVDLMIGSLASRQTNASFSFSLLFENSAIRSISGTEKCIEARVPTKEILIALKLHSARMTDARDIAALCNNVDFDTIAKFAKTGGKKEALENVTKLHDYFKSDNFKDSFKGIFSIEKLPSGSIENAVKLMDKLKREL